MSCEEWVAHHRCQGHNPHPAPTKENPERWDCDCGGINRILTVEQIAKKFAHWNGGTDRPGMSDSLRHYVLPKDDPVAALNILRRAAGLAQWPSEDTPVEE